MTGHNGCCVKNKITFLGIRASNYKQSPDSADLLYILNPRAAIRTVTRHISNNNLIKRSRGVGSWFAVCLFGSGCPVACAKTAGSCPIPATRRSKRWIFIDKVWNGGLFPVKYYGKCWIIVGNTDICDTSGGTWCMAFGPNMLSFRQNIN